MTTIVDFVKELDALIKENQSLRECNSELRRLVERPRYNNRPKLSERDVKDIRAAYRGGMAQVSLANNYGVNPSTISRIVRGFYH